MSLVTREVERSVMERVQVFVCDGCEATALPDENAFPPLALGWMMLIGREGEGTHFCGWACLSQHALEQMGAEAS